MKKNWFFVLALLFGLLAVDSVYANTNSHFEDVCNKLGRGLTNVVTSPLEFGYEIDRGIETSGLYKGCCFGVIRGFVKAVSRLGVGVYEVVTFPIEIPDEFAPIIEPEFVFVKD